MSESKVKAKIARRRERRESDSRAGKRGVIRGAFATERGGKGKKLMRRNETSLENLLFCPSKWRELVSIAS